jgi:hypothetical protein
VISRGLDKQQGPNALLGVRGGSLNDFFEVFAPVIGDGEQALCLSSMPVA